MSESPVKTSSPIGLVGIEELRHNWGWFLALGMLLVFVGMAAIGSSFIATMISVKLFGWLLVFGGVVQAANFLWRKKWKGFYIDLISAVLYIVIGVLMVAHPLEWAELLTLFIAVFLTVGGIFRIAACLASQAEHKGWMLIHGIVTLLLGVAIWVQWPLSGLWVIGLFVGIDMLFGGWSLIMLAFAAKNFPETPATGTPA